MAKVELIIRLKTGAFQHEIRQILPAKPSELDWMLIVEKFRKILPNTQALQDGRTDDGTPRSG